MSGLHSPGAFSFLDEKSISNSSLSTQVLDTNFTHGPTLHFYPPIFSTEPDNWNYTGYVDNITEEYHFNDTEINIVNVVYSVIAVLGIVFNILSIIVFTQGRRSSRRDIRILILNLCVTDLLFSLSGPIPYAVYYYGRGVDKFPHNDILCKIWKFVFINCVDMSPMANLAIAIERLIVVFSPARTLRLRNRKKTMYIIIAVFWIFTMALNVEYIYRPIVIKGSCTSNTMLYINHFEEFTYYIMLKFFLPTVVIVILYAIIGAKLMCCQPVGASNMDKNQLRAIRARNRLVKMLFIVALVTFVAWTPSNVETIVILRLDDLGPLRTMKWISAALFGLQLTNGFTTPIIYFSFDEHFKKDLDEILCCRKKSKRRKRKQENSRTRIKEDISAAEPSTTSTTTVIDSGV